MNRQREPTNTHTEISYMLLFLPKQATVNKAGPEQTGEPETSSGTATPAAFPDTSARSWLGIEQQ